MQANHPDKVGHHFKDAKEVAKFGRGFCMRHNQICEPDDMCGRSTFVIAGVSCRLFSTANKDRTKGTKDHEDAGLAEAWVLQVERDEPDSAVLENVFGFAMRESKAEPASPLVQLLKYIKERLPMYSVRVYWMEGHVFLVLARRRVFVHLIHKRAGG